MSKFYIINAKNKLDMNSQNLMFMNAPLLAN